MKLRFNKEKTIKGIVLGTIIGLLVGSFGSVAYAFFSYTKTGRNQQLIAGDIYMYYNSPNNITLTNMMPRSTPDENEYFEFTIKGKNESDYDIIYDINVSHGVDQASPKVRIRDEFLRFRLDEKIDNGAWDTKIEAGTYSDFQNGVRIYKDTIEAGTNTETTHYYRLYVWISDSIQIYSGDLTSNDGDYSVDEWENLYASFKVSTHGDFNEKDVPRALYDIVKTDATSDATISNLYAKEGEGNFLRSTTATDTYPVYYYRGEVTNNNVVFANKCWKIVRTTDTGGTKLIYNGETQNIYNSVPINQNQYQIVSNNIGFVFDETDKTWTISITESTAIGFELIFSVLSQDNYTLIATKNNSPGSGGIQMYQGDDLLTSTGFSPNKEENISQDYNSISDSDTVKFVFNGGGFSSSNPGIIKIKMLQKVAAKGCNNTGTASQLPITTSFQDTDKSNSPAYVGYNYGQVYEVDYLNWTSGALFGSSYTWDGTNYKLVDATETTPNSTHHYSCNATSADATCSDLRYVYYMGRSTKYYITLQNGKGVEDALKEMLSESSDTNKSKIQGVINTWYETYIEDDYDEYVEDTKWCMDRSVSTANLGGWNPNGGSLSEYMYFDVSKRINTASASTPPVFTCSNINDVMTKKNGKLDYPVALLTYDEASLAGVQWSPPNSSSYLLTGSFYLLLSPSSFYIDNRSFVGLVATSLSDSYTNTDYGVRPSLSLKHGTLVKSGTGTVSDPYILESEN